MTTIPTALFNYTRLFLRKIVLADAAERACKIVRQLVPFCAGSNAVVRIACRFVIDITANITNVFHCAVPPNLILQSHYITSALRCKVIFVYFL